MKVRDLLEAIRERLEKYGEDFLDWDVYTEQLDSEEREEKKNWLTDSEEWKYVQCAGFWTTFPKEKAFTINVNY